MTTDPILTSCFSCHEEFPSEDLETYDDGYQLVPVCQSCMKDYVLSKE